MKKLLLAALAVATLPAAAQDAPPLKVLYQPGHGRNAYLVDKAVEIVLQRPAFLKAAKADPQTLVVSVPQVGYRVSTDDNVPFDFMLHFVRDGDLVGEAAESCTNHKLNDCADLIASDFTAAAAIHR